MDGGRLVEEVTGPAADAEATLGGALGFLRVAGDPEERATGVARIAAACGQCHGAEQAVAPLRPAWSHHDGAAWVVDAVVWHREGDPPGAEVPDAVRAATASAGSEDSAGARAERVLVACAGCHAGGGK